MCDVLCAVALTGCVRGDHTHYSLPLTSSCDPPLLFVHFDIQVNNDVLVVLD